MITILFQILAGFLGTISCAILFEVPRRYYVYCGMIGACGWFIYLLIMQFWVAPVTFFLICGIFCLVPGMEIYNFTYNFFIGNSIKAAQIGVQVLKIAIAIAVGITAGYELSPKFFYSYHKMQKNKNSF